MKQYKGSFKSLDGNIYEVVFTLLNTTSNETVTITLGETPIVTTLNGEDDIYTPIKYDSAKINIVTDKIYDDLNAVKYGDIEVKLINTTTSEWVWYGYVKPQLYNQDIFYNTNEITIECCGFLELLKYIDYDKNSGSISLFHIIFNGILNVNSNGNIYIQDSCNITYEDFAKPWGEKTNHPLFDLYINNRNFIDDDNEPLKYNEVLEAIFKYFNLVCIPYGYNVYIVDYNALVANTNKNVNNVVWFYKYYEENSNDKVTLSPIMNISKNNISYISLSKSKIYNKISIVGKRYSASIEADQFKDNTELLDDSWECFLSVMNYTMPFYTNIDSTIQVTYERCPDSLQMSETFIMNKIYKNTSDKIKFYNYKIYKGPNDSWEFTQLEDDNELVNTRDILSYVVPGYTAVSSYVGTCIMSEVDSCKGIFTKKDLDEEEEFTPGWFDRGIKISYKVKLGGTQIIDVPDIDKYPSNLAYPNTDYNTQFNPEFSDCKVVLALSEFYKKTGELQLDLPEVSSNPYNMYYLQLPFMSIKLDEGYIHNKCRLKVKLNGKFKPIIKGQDFRLGYTKVSADHDDGIISHKFNHDTNKMEYWVGYDDDIGDGYRNYSIPIYNSVWESVDSFKVFSSSKFEQYCTIKIGDKYWDGNNLTTGVNPIKIDIDITDVHKFSTKSTPYFYTGKEDEDCFYIDLPKIDMPDSDFELQIYLPQIEFEMSKPEGNNTPYNINNTIYGGYVWYDDIDVQFVYMDEKNNNESDNLDDIKYETVIDEDVTNEFTQIENIITTNTDGLYDKSSILYNDGYLKELWWDIDNYGQGPKALSAEEYKLKSYLAEYSNDRKIIDLDIVGVNTTPFSVYSIDYNDINSNSFVINSIERDWKSNNSTVQLVEILNTSDY